MDWQDLDRHISELQQLTPNVAGMQIFLRRHEWQAVWDKCKTIQDGFKAVRYPTKDERQAAWERFCSLRNEASSRHQREREQLRDRSASHRGDILDLAKRAHYSGWNDLLFSFDRTGADEMKQLGALLTRARKLLSDWKEEMIREHKDECFTAINAAQASHNDWWERYKAQGEERRRAHQARQAQWLEQQAVWDERKRDRRRRVAANIDGNREKRSRAVQALERTYDRVRELRDKLAESTSPKWLAIHAEWLAEAQAKAHDIEASIRRLTEWMEEGEAELRNM